MSTTPDAALTAAWSAIAQRLARLHDIVHRFTLDKLDAFDSPTPATWADVQRLDTVLAVLDHAYQDIERHLT